MTFLQIFKCSNRPCLYYLNQGLFQSLKHLHVKIPGLVLTKFESLAYVLDPLGQQGLLLLMHKFVTFVL